MNFINLNSNLLGFISNFKLKIENYIFYLLILFLPTQLGKHFWPDFSFIAGLRIDYLSPTIYFTDVLIGSLFGIWLIKQMLNGQMVKLFKKTMQPYNYIAIAALMFVVVNFYLTGEVLKTLYFALKIFEISFVAYYTAKFMSRKKVFENSVFVFAGGIFFQSFLAIAQFVNQKSIGGVLYYFGERTFNGSTAGIANASLNGELVLRPYATFPHPNVLAGYLVVVMTIMLFSLSFRNSNQEARGKKHEVRVMNWLSPALILNSLFLVRISALILGTIALFLSMSRIGILLWVFILGYFFIKKINIRTFIIGVFLSILFLMLSPLGARFTQVALTDDAIAQRLSLINASFQMIASSPLFGVGLFNFIPTLLLIQQPLTIGTYLQPVHNIFLLVAAETGLIGLGFFGWFLWKTLQRIRNQESGIREILYILFTVILITGMFDHYWITLQQGQLLFAFVIGLCWANYKTSSGS